MEGKRPREASEAVEVQSLEGSMFNRSMQDQECHLQASPSFFYIFIFQWSTSMTKLSMYEVPHPAISEHAGAFKWELKREFKFKREFKCLGRDQGTKKGTNSPHLSTELSGNGILSPSSEILSSRGMSGMPWYISSLLKFGSIASEGGTPENSRIADSHLKMNNGIKTRDISSLGRRKLLQISTGRSPGCISFLLCYCFHKRLSGWFGVIRTSARGPLGMGKRKGCFIA